MRAAPGTRQPGCLSYKEIRTPSSWLLKRDNVPSEFGGELQGAGELPQIGGLAATITGTPGSVEMEGGCLSAGTGDQVGQDVAAGPCCRGTARRGGGWGAPLPLTLGSGSVAFLVGPVRAEILERWKRMWVDLKGLRVGQGASEGATGRSAEDHLEALVEGEAVREGVGEGGI